jgi:hypothetical protein
MQSSLEKLRKFFRLEHENGYANSAIIGGLAKMLDFWEGEARADGIQEEVIQAVVQRLRSYDGLSPQSRADALKGLWKRIGETYPETQQKPQLKQRPEFSQIKTASSSKRYIRDRNRSSEPREQQTASPPPPRSESVAGARPPPRPPRSTPG